MASAEECRLPDIGSRLTDHRPVIRCLIERVNEVEAENNELKSLVGEVGELRTEVPPDYLNDSGNVTFEEGRSISRAEVIVDGSNLGRAGSQPLDHDVLIEVFGNTAGCSLSLKLTQFARLGPDELFSETLDPCAFRYNPVNGAWSIASPCGEVPSGVDGDQKPSTDESRADILARLGGACIFAESETKSNVGEAELSFRSDRSQGLFLTTAPGEYRELRGRLRCSLVVAR